MLKKPTALVRKINFTRHKLLKYYKIQSRKGCQVYEYIFTFDELVYLSLDYNRTSVKFYSVLSFVE